MPFEVKLIKDGVTKVGQLITERAGEQGLRKSDPAKLVLGVRRSDALIAAEFAAELELAVAERALARSDEKRRLSEGSSEPQLDVDWSTE